MRSFRRFSYKDTNLRVASAYFDVVTDEIVTQRKTLEKYIRSNKSFLGSYVPVEIADDAPTVVKRMSDAAKKTGLGPMAAVAGTLAQLGAEKALSLGATEVIVENGGDMFVVCDSPLTIGIHSGDDKIGDSLAFNLPPSQIAICSSSGRMGHSHSLGKASLATAVSINASLADAAATLLGNIIQSAADLQAAVARVGSIGGIDAVMAIIDGQIGLYGRLPQLVKNPDANISAMITRDRFSFI